MPEDDPQNPLTRRLFLVSPKEVLLAELGVSASHEVAAMVGIVSPKLAYETWFEGWSLAWRVKAKEEFLHWFLEVWDSEGAPASLPPDFLRGLRSARLNVSTFDQWWTIQPASELIEIDDSWRPS